MTSERRHAGAAGEMEAAIRWRAGGLEALTGRIEERDLTNEMRSSYLDYAMSVIVGRALPDVRDGLKPVHRRVLYAMHDLGLQPNRPYRKSATIVGEVMGKYHPHGDSAIYDTLARMAQDFSLRYMLVDGQGNFGSIDDDPPAAMRYTEARLARLSTEMLRDIDADTVDFGPNYDESQREPLVLPARFPNLLVNGSPRGSPSGWRRTSRRTTSARRSAPSRPTSRIREIDLEGLMEHIKGPDFPGGGIMSAEGVRDAYASGRATVRIRARAHVEPLKGGRDAIIVTELPFMVKKGGDGGLITKIAELVREKKITGISDLRDESDRSGMRLVIETKRGGDPPEVVLNQLYKRTPMQTTFGDQHGRAGRRRAADPEPQGADRALRLAPARGGHPAHPARAAPGGGAGAHPRGAADRARQPRRGDRADPRLERHGQGARGPDGQASSSRSCRPRRSSTCALPGSRRSSRTRSATSTKT